MNKWRIDGDSCAMDGGRGGRERKRERERRGRLIGNDGWLWAEAAAAKQAGRTRSQEQDARGRRSARRLQLSVPY